MPKRFDDLSQEDAFALVDEPTAFEEKYDFVYEGDHWREGDGFVGPTTATERSDAEQSAVREGWQRRFVSDNLLREIVKRACDAVVGKEPQWSAELARPLTDKEQEDAAKIPAPERTRLDESGAAMAEWWDRTQGVVFIQGERRRASAHMVLKEFAFAARTFGRAGLRIRIPSGRLNENGELPASTPREALRHIFVEAVLPDTGRIYTDPESLYDLSIVAYEDEDEVDTSKTIKYAELSFLSGQGGGGAAEGAPLYGQEEGEPLTVLRVVYSGSEEVFEQAFDLRGRLLFFEGTHEALVTSQMLEQQKALNTEQTELAIVLDQEGFPEVILTNTLGPGTWETDVTTGKATFVPTEYGRGPGKRAFVMGEPVEDGMGGAKGYTSPGVHQLQAADVEGYLKGMTARRLAMLRQARQLWTETTDDATASGESRVQALVDFLQDAADFKAVMDGALKWMLETVWSLALDIAGTPGRDHDLRFVADCKLTLPFIPAAMRKAILDERDAGLRSDETAMSDLGIEDVQAELQRIAESPRGKMNMRKVQAEIMANTTRAGAGIAPAATFAGVEPDEAAALARMDNVDTPEGGR
jgi:hypothetical protein